MIFFNLPINHFTFRPYVLWTETKTSEIIPTKTAPVRSLRKLGAPHAIHAKFTRGIFAFVCHFKVRWWMFGKISPAVSALYIWFWCFGTQRVLYKSVLQTANNCYFNEKKEKKSPVNKLNTLEENCVFNFHFVLKDHSSLKACLKARQWR